MRTELYINDPKCESITLVPDEYNPKHAGDAQPERRLRGKDEVKIYPWDCGTPRMLPESEKLVPKSYRPHDRDSVQFVSHSNGDCLSESRMASQGNLGGIESVMRAFKRCFDNPALERGVLLRKHEEKL